LFDIDVLEQWVGEKSDWNADWCDGTHPRLLVNTVVHQLLSRCVVQIYIVCVDLFHSCLVQVTFSLSLGKAIQNSANVGLFFDLGKVLVHQFIGPVVTHAVLEQVVSGLGEGFETCNYRVVHLF
jgi:hypothetical protein